MTALIAALLATFGLSTGAAATHDAPKPAPIVKVTETAQPSTTDTTTGGMMTASSHSWT